MNYLDIVIAIVIGFFVFKGLNKGLVKSLAGIIGFFAALVFTTLFMGDLAYLLTEIFSFNNAISYLISALLLFFGTIAAVKMSAELFRKLLDINVLTKWLDTGGGGIFGFLLGSLIISSIFVFLSFFPFTDRLFPETENSMFYPYAHNFFPVAYDVVIKFGPETRNFTEITEDILKGKPLDSLENSIAGRELLKYWDSIKEKTQEVLDFEKKN